MSTVAILTVMLYAVGAVQGIVFGFILIKSTKYNRLANRILAAILFLLSYRLIVQTMRLFELGYYDIWYYFMLDLSWVHGALLYFYVLALIKPGFRLKKSDWIHFLPLLIQVGMSEFVRLQNLYWDGTRESLSWAGYWGYAVWMNYSTIYIVASILIICYAVAARKALRFSLSQIEMGPDRMLWVKRIIVSFAAYFTLVFIVLIADLLIYNVTLNNDYYYFTRFYYYPFFAGISVLTYWLGIEGYKRKDDQGLAVKTELSEAKRSHLEGIAARLKKAMDDDKLYTDPGLTLGGVADTLDVKPYLLSQCLKEVFESKFSDYVNGLRVEEVKRLLEDPESDKYTLLSLAMNAGFNSKSSFNRSVKKHLGIPPSQLRRTP